MIARKGSEWVRTATVEFDGGLKGDLLFECLGIGVLCFGGVEVVDVGLVVLVVVELHDLVGDDGFEGVVGVWEWGKGVRGQCGSLIIAGRDVRYDQSEECGWTEGEYGDEEMHGLVGGSEIRTWAVLAGETVL